MNECRPLSDDLELFSKWHIGPLASECVCVLRIRLANRHPMALFPLVGWGIARARVCVLVVYCFPFFCVWFY